MTLAENNNNPADETTSMSLTDHPKAKKGIDLQTLAEQILRLLKEEARVERERTGTPRTWK